MLDVFELPGLLAVGVGDNSTEGGDGLVASEDQAAGAVDDKSTGGVHGLPGAGSSGTRSGHSSALLS